MAKLMRFLSLTALTQLLLLANQLLLLPAQVRAWGHEATATWYSALAVASIAIVADLGLRTAGHEDFVQALPSANNPAAHARFRQLWAWIRILLLAATTVAIAFDAAFSSWSSRESYPLWRAELIAAIGLESLLITRIVYLDTSGQFARAESSYVIMVASRLVIGLPAVLWWGVTADGLALIFLGASVIAVVLQERWCRDLGIMTALEALPETLSWKMLADVRFTLADPCANWIRVNLPVLVLSGFASAPVVTGYVALRAVFGIVRQSIVQLARPVSVDVTRLRSQGAVGQATNRLALALIASAVLASAIAAGVVADNHRMLNLWIDGIDAADFHWIVATMGISAPFLGWQLMAWVMLRQGRLRSVSVRHYGYMLGAMLAALAGAMMHSVGRYLMLVLLAELIVSASFLTRFPGEPDAHPTETRAALWRGLTAAMVGSLSVALLWWVVQTVPSPLFHQTGRQGLVGWAAVTAACTLALCSLVAALNADLCFPVLARLRSRRGS